MLLRAELSRVERGRGKRFSAEVRARAIEYGRRHRAAGASWTIIGSELAMNYETVRRRCVEEAISADAARRDRADNEQGERSCRRGFPVRLSRRRTDGARRRDDARDAAIILGTSRAVRVYAYPEPVDLRKGYDGLYGLVKVGLGRDPLGGHLYLFVSRTRKGCKVLFWDGTGSAWNGEGSPRSGVRSRRRWCG
jgi:hypothetical protein